MIRYFLLVLIGLCASQTGNANELGLCQSCHGAALEGKDELKAPALAGREDWYLSAQLQAFKNGWRGQEADSLAQSMAAVVVNLTDSEIQSLAATIAEWPLTARSAYSVSESDLALAAPIYNAVCSACHGGKGQGNRRLKAPALTALSQDYLLSQIQKFRAGHRGSHPQDRTGGQMQRGVKAISTDAEAAALASFIRAMQP